MINRTLTVDRKEVLQWNLLLEVRDKDEATCLVIQLTVTHAVHALEIMKMTSGLDGNGSSVVVHVGSMKSVLKIMLVSPVELSSYVHSVDIIIVMLAYNYNFMVDISISVLLCSICISMNMISVFY